MNNIFTIMKKNIYSYALFILTCLMILIYMQPTKLSLLLFLCILIILIIIEPNITYIGWIMGYAYSSEISEILGIPSYLILVPIMIFGTLVRFIYNREFKVPIVVFVISLLIGILGCNSLILSRNVASNLIPLFMLFCSVFVMLSIIISIKSDPNVLGLVNRAYVFASIAALISVVLNGEIVGSGRMSLGSNVRKMANIASPALVIIFIEIIKSYSKDKTSILYKRFSSSKNYLILILIAITLISTVSRGAYLAVGISIAIAYIYSFIWSKSEKLNRNKLLKWFIFIPIVVIYLVKFVTNNIAGDYMSRVSLDMWEGNARWDIWNGALIQMSPIEIVFGAGPGSFRDLAILSGFDYYAHSVFIDTLVTLGIIGFILLIVSIIALIIYCIRIKNLYGISMIILTILLYSTHGNLNGSMDFWTLIAIVYGSCIIKSKNMKDVKI